MKNTILITGATGNIGSELVALLANQPEIKEIRIATRHPDSAQAELLKAYNTATVKPMLYDVEKPETLNKAFQGVDKLFLIAPLSDTIMEFQKKTIDMAKEHGVSYIAKVSVDAASPDTDNPLGKAHWQGEELIRNTGIPSTMLRPTLFMQHLLLVPGLYEKGDTNLYLPTGKAKMAFLDCRDIAYVASKLILDPSIAQSLDNDFIYLTGPKALSAEDMASELSLLNGKQFTHIDGESEFLEHSKELGSPAELLEIYKAGAQGYFEETHTEDFEKLTGRTPNPFGRFISDYRHYFI